MDSIQDKNIAKSRSIVMGLLIICSFQEGPSADCPLQEIRNNATDAEKYEYVMGLSGGEISAILKYHEACYKKKMPRLIPD
jgi:hypothetical protein